MFRSIYLTIIISTPVILFAGCSKSRPTPPPTDIDCVVVIHLDTTRTDDMGSYSGLVDTPNMDALAATGMRFTNSIATVPKTAPSVANFFSGSYAKNNGVYKAGHALQEKIRTVAEALQNSGYKTVGYTANMSISDLGFVQAKSTDTHKRKNVQRLHFGQGFDEFHSFPPLTDTLDGTVPQVVEQAIEYIDENETSPFFMWMILVEPHGPYTPPPPYDTLYTEDRELLIPSRDIYENGPDDPVDPADGEDGHPKAVTGIFYVDGENNSDYYVARHMAEVTYTDYWIGKLIDRVNKLPGNTLFIITADHGESFGDADYWFGHGNNVRYPCVNVPLIISCTGVIPKGVSDALVANIDLAPTILDLLNVEDPLFKPDGRSLVPAFEEEDPWPLRMVPIRSAVYQNDWRGVRSKQHSFQCVYNEDTKDLEWQNLYDLKEDPTEQNNIADSEVALLESHRQFFSEWFSNPNVHRVEEIDMSDTEEMQDRLRSLGYIE